jgi:hypothetical protein
MTDADFEFTCRYDVLGPPNGCRGACEGTGWIPHFEAIYRSSPRQVLRHGPRPDDEPPIYRVLWFLAEAKAPTDDGWHFLPCPDCRADDPLIVLAYALMGTS